MTSQEFVIELDNPITGWLCLPDRAGTIRGEIIAVEPRDPVPWIKMRVPTWHRWTTQVKVGQPSKVGLAPGVTEIWAPADAVSTGEQKRERLKNALREPAETYYA
jgi:hypothetical protein